jgi:cell division protein ZapA
MPMPQTPKHPQPPVANERDGAETMDAITVDIYDQTYHLRGHDAAYIRQLAEMVDAKMRAVASHGKTVDSLRVAVLAALNIADELATLEHASKSQGSLRTRAHSLAGLLDTVLSEERKIG